MMIFVSAVIGYGRLGVWFEKPGVSTIRASWGTFSVVAVALAKLTWLSRLAHCSLLIARGARFSAAGEGYPPFRGRKFLSGSLILELCVVMIARLKPFLFEAQEKVYSANFRTFSW